MGLLRSDTRVKSVGTPQISTRVTEEQYAFIMSNGGSVMIRRLVFHDHARRAKVDPTLIEERRSYLCGQFGQGGKRINVRLCSLLFKFVQGLGGAIYIRALIQSFMEHKMKEAKTG